MRIRLIFPFLLFRSSYNAFQLKEGDFLFQDMDCGDICGAIEAVTRGFNGGNFSHIALVVVKNGLMFALEAISDGVTLTPIDEFLNRSLDNNNNPKVAVGRLNRKYRRLIKPSISYALSLLGKPYNNEFIFGNQKYYCSELIYESFKRANKNSEIFNLEPMTFKQPGTDDFLPAWVEYYKELGMQIPEGKPGLNPGGISRSDNIKIIHRYGDISGWNNSN